MSDVLHRTKQKPRTTAPSIERSLLFYAFAQLVTTFSSQLQTGHMLNGTIPKIQIRKRGPKIKRGFVNWKKNCILQCQTALDTVQEGIGGNMRVCQVLILNKVLFVSVHTTICCVRCVSIFNCIVGPFFHVCIKNP